MELKGVEPLYTAVATSPDVLPFLTVRLGGFYSHHAAPRCLGSHLHKRRTHCKSGVAYIPISDPSSSHLDSVDVYVLELFLRSLFNYE